MAENRNVRGNHINPKSVSTGQVLSNINGGQYQASIDGLVVPVAPGLGVKDAIDPSSTSTPLQDSADLIGHNGAILLPPETINESQTFEWPTGIDIYGWGIGTLTADNSGPVSAIQWDAGVQPLDIPNGEYGDCYMDGVKIVGGGDDAAGVSSVFSLSTGADVRNLRLGRIAVEEFYVTGSMFDFTGNPVFQSHFGDHVSIRKVDNGDGDYLFNFPFGLSNTMGNVNAYPTGTTSNSNTTIFRLEGMDLRVSSLNLGRASNRIYQSSADEGHHHFGYINWEPTHQLESAGRLFNIFSKNLRVDNIRITTGDKAGCYDLQNGSGHLHLAKPVVRSDSWSGDLVRIEGEPELASWYYGPSSDINNRAGTATGLVRAMYDAGTGNG